MQTMVLDDHHDIQVGEVYVHNGAVYDRSPASRCVQWKHGGVDCLLRNCYTFRMNVLEELR